MCTTDMADELFRGPETELPAGVRLATAKRGGVTITRVEIAREGLARPRGRYVTLEMPSVSVLDERDTDVIETGAAELRALLPPEGPVLVLGIGNRRVTADALGPRTAQKILVTMGPQHTLPVRGIRPVAALAPGVSGDTGLTLRQLAAAMVDAVRPAALICVDSLCSAEAARLGRTIQFSDTGLHPADARHARHLDAAALGVPVIAAGIHTLHDETLNDYPSYTGSYANSRTVVQQYLAQYPSIKVVLDVHRDAIETENGSRMAPVCTVDGRQAAQVMIICGCDNGTTVQLPDWRQNLRVAAAWERAMEGMYPGFTRPVLFSYRFYNQDLTTGSLLIEIGGHGNNLNEALYAGQLAAKGLAAALLGGA